MVYWVCGSHLVPQQRGANSNLGSRQHSLPGAVGAVLSRSSTQSHDSVPALPLSRNRSCRSELSDLTGGTRKSLSLSRSSSVAHLAGARHLQLGIETELYLKANKAEPEAHSLEDFAQKFAHSHNKYVPPRTGFQMAPKIPSSPRDPDHESDHSEWSLVKDDSLFPVESFCTSAPAGVREFLAMTLG